MTNRLAQSTSPYLRQHADNPVDWWEWGEEAFAEARRRDVPVFLSIGYAACHWCHVMAHESFEDPEIARVLNAGFVSIKVDREERPDLDAVYMEATVALTGHGGWPMSVFLDHAGRPFYAGTYFPPEPRHGMPSFPSLLGALSEAWHARRSQVENSASRIDEALNARMVVSASSDAMDVCPVLEDAVATALAEFDAQRGGFGGAPKFPPSMVLEWLLRAGVRDPASPALAMAESTLVAMARGGMYDQLAGGFARYSVDAAWVVPHFEKMLYDNALLLRVYVHWYRLTESAFAARIARQTALFLLTELRTPEGAFASSLDADSEGGEGAFYAWRPAQLIDVLGPRDGAWAADLLSVTPGGTFEHGLSTLQLLREPDDAERWNGARSRLLAAREARPRPARDDKVVAAWNGLAIAALAEAGALLGEPAFVDAARAAAEHLQAVHGSARGPGRLCRTSMAGRPGDNDGVLADYADLAEGLLALYQVTGEEGWFSWAANLVDTALRHFADGSGGFFDTADDAPALVRRPREASDNAEPSGWLALANACLTLSALTGDSRLRAVAEQALGIVPALTRHSVRSAGWGLAALEALTAGPLEVAVVGPGHDRDAQLLHRVALAATAPGAVVARGDGDSQVPLLRDRGSQAAAFVCRQFTCELPTADPGALARRLGARSGPAGLAAG